MANVKGIPRLCECGHLEEDHAMREAGTSAGFVLCMSKSCACTGFEPMPDSEPEQPDVDKTKPLCGCGHPESSHEPAKDGVCVGSFDCECESFASMPDSESNQDKTGEETPEQPYKIGDSVILKTGGPAMTVTGGTVTKVECAWFNVASDLNKELFLPKVIRKLTFADMFR